MKQSESTVPKISRRTFTWCFGSAILTPPSAGWAAPGTTVTVHKDPGCDCCTGWVTHLQQNGFRVDVIETQEINRVKTRLGVPAELAACHTAEAEGFLFEGHVPAAAIQRFLGERPQARGLAVPGMPAGSPGMGGDPEEYDVIIFGILGPNERRVYARFKADKQL